MAGPSPQLSKSPLIRVVKDADEKQRVEMLCPRCECWQDVLAYKNPEMVGKFANALNAIVKCARCRHLFSPRWLNEE